MLAGLTSANIAQWCVTGPQAAKRQLQRQAMQLQNRVANGRQCSCKTVGGCQDLRVVGEDILEAAKTPQLPARRPSCALGRM